MKLPVLVSVPHAGLDIPEELRPYNRLTPREIAEDGDQGADEIYNIRDEVSAFVTTPVARAFLDMNRAEDDRRKDGVVKTHTCWNVPIYETRPPEEVFSEVIARYHRPYHNRLTELAARVVIGIDCHTMAEKGPPVGPDPGRERPLVCIGTGNGSFPLEQAESLVQYLAPLFRGLVTIDTPFRGGYIVRHHGRELPWLQLELSRTSVFSNREKRLRIIAALDAWLRVESWWSG
jgi:formiminoglutamase